MCLHRMLRLTYSFRFRKHKNGRILLLIQSAQDSYTLALALLFIFFSSLFFYSVRWIESMEISTSFFYVSAFFYCDVFVSIYAKMKQTNRSTATTNVIAYHHHYHHRHHDHQWYTADFSCFNSENCCWTFHLLLGGGVLSEPYTWKLDEKSIPLTIPPWRYNDMRYSLWLRINC